MRYLLPIILIIALTGCESPRFPWLSKAKTATVTESEKHQMTERTDTEVLVTTEPLCPPELPPEPMAYEVLGKRMIVPSNARVEMKVGSKMTEKSWSLTEALGNFKATTNVGILILGGALAVAIGIALCFFVGAFIGLPVAVFGVALIACGVTIEQYPWVFLLVLLFGLGVGAYLVIRLIQGQTAKAEAKDQTAALGEIVTQIEALPAEAGLALKDKLAKSGVAPIVRKVVDRVKGRSNG